MGINSCGTTLIDNGVFNNIGAVTWDTTAKTSGFTGVSGNGYFVNTTSGAITVTLPASPSAGDVVGIKDYANTADTNNITIGRNGSNINGDAADYTINIEGLSVLLVYVDGTKGWLVTNAAQASDITGAYTIATGGTITTDGDYKIHSFTSPGTFCVSQIGDNGAGGPSNIDFLVVAGGGGGGGSPVSPKGGGGGAGGLRTQTCSPISVQGYPITIGAGGSAPSSGGSRGCSGSNSVFNSITSAGGGGGGDNDAPENSGGSGGSGGGGAPTGSSSGAGSGNTPPVSPPQGNPGGNSSTSPFSAGGGGGSGASGQNAGPGSTPGAGGDGGNGTSVTPIFGTAPKPYYIANGSNAGASACGVFAGGGGGGTPNGDAAGGSGGTGGGGDSGPASGAGVANTGGGGGGGERTPAGGAQNGGSGIVLIRYKFQ